MQLLWQERDVPGRSVSNNASSQSSPTLFIQVQLVTVPCFIDTRCLTHGLPGRELNSMGTQTLLSSAMLKLAIGSRAMGRLRTGSCGRTRGRLSGGKLSARAPACRPRSVGSRSAPACAHVDDGDVASSTSWMLRALAFCVRWHSNSQLTVNVSYFYLRL